MRIVQGCRNNHGKPKQSSHKSTENKQNAGIPICYKTETRQSGEGVISPRSSNVEIIGANPISATMRAVILDLFGGSSKTR